MKIIKVFYSGYIYSPETVMRAIEDYADICSIEPIKLSDGLMCVFSKSKEDLGITSLEFSNYLIELANARNV